MSPVSDQIRKDTAMPNPGAHRKYFDHLGVELPKLPTKVDLSDLYLTNPRTDFVCSFGRTWNREHIKLNERSIPGGVNEEELGVISDFNQTPKEVDRLARKLANRLNGLRLSKKVIDALVIVPSFEPSNHIQGYNFTWSLLPVIQSAVHILEEETKNVPAGTWKNNLDRAREVANPQNLKEQGLKSHVELFGEELIMIAMCPAYVAETDKEHPRYAPTFNIILSRNTDFLDVQKTHLTQSLNVSDKTNDATFRKYSGSFPYIIPNDERFDHINNKIGFIVYDALVKYPALQLVLENRCPMALTQDLRKAAREKPDEDLPTHILAALNVPKESDMALSILLAIAESSLDKLLD